MYNQFLGLERRVVRGGKESVDHQKGGHDDVCNVVARVIVELIGKRDPTNIAPEALVAASNMYAPQSPRLGTYDTGERDTPIWR